jgi:1,4-dihydroxy-2-naphthoate polyprenyltransferase
VLGWFDSFARHTEVKNINMAAVEPTRDALRNPFLRYFFATRPAFLTAAVTPCFIGFATAWWSGVPFKVGLALLTLLGAALVHAGVNVLNDYYDSLNGTDNLNTERVFPFTGGSRFIQNGVLTDAETARYGVSLLVAGGAIGIGLALTSGPLVWVIGMIGFLIGWAYSAPPLSLNGRGLGELSVALGFGILIPWGADYVQRGVFDWLPILAGTPMGLLVANLLYINQFPDRRADEAVGKHHWVVRLGARRARWGYGAAAVAAFAVLGIEIGLGMLPALAWIAAVPAVLSLVAAQRLVKYAEQPAALEPAIRFTILAALSHGLLLSIALFNA